MNRDKLKEMVEQSLVIDRQKANIKEMASMSISDSLKKLHTGLNGLNDDSVNERRKRYGKNEITHGKKKTLAGQLIASFVNPFTIILFFLALISSITDMILPYLELFGSTRDDFDMMTVLIITVLVLVSGILRFVQESRSNEAMEKLLHMITTTCTVRRKGQEMEIPLEDALVGDIALLSAGDMIPGDGRVIRANDLFISQSSLTGESEPTEKFIYPENEDKLVTDYNNVVFLGTSVVSGSGEMVIMATGNQTLLGMTAKEIGDEPVETNFTKGVNAVSWVLIRFMLAMVPTVFVVNGLTKGDWLEALLFGISVAVGLTPEMLPMIVTTCLAKGAVSMSRKSTIVKNLNSIQNFGAMDILCSDKTGTLTQDNVVLEYHLDALGKEDDRILGYAYLNSYFQTGYKNLMDKAIIKKLEEKKKDNPNLGYLNKTYKKIDEIPFDFNRRRLSVVVEDSCGQKNLITKGALDEMISICSYVEISNKVVPLKDAIKKEIVTTVNALNEKGFRVLVIAKKSFLSTSYAFNNEDESEMVLLGYLAFLDPPKESAAQALKSLGDYGVSVKILTGDNEKVTRTICDQVGIDAKNIITSKDLENMSDDDLQATVESVNVFAKLTPNQKTRIVQAYRDKGHTVGFMGDGINDAPAMKSSDISISVDSAIDVAKETADIILLKKDLMILKDGIIEGRKTYANMIKYIKITASSNFGNMFSVLAASALLPFLPMMSIHLIFLNMIYDISCIALPWDNVDEEYLAIPRKWDASSIGHFMIWLGPTSSIFDFTTYAVMYFIICPFFLTDGVLFNDLASIYSGSELIALQTSYMAMFQAGWFIESMWTQTLVIHMIRTPKIPFIQSHASLPVMLLTFTGIALLTIIPFTTLGSRLGFIPLPFAFFIYLIPCVILYMALAQSIKHAYVRHFGELL